MAADKDQPDEDRVDTAKATPEAVSEPEPVAEPEAGADKEPPQPEKGSAATRERASRSNTGSALAGAAAALGVVLLVAAIVAAVFFYVKWNDKKSEIDNEASARAAACTYAKILPAYDFQNVDAYFKSVLDGATGQFKDEFGKTSQDLRDVITKAQIKSETTDTQCGVKSIKGDSADIVVALGVSISSLGTQGQKVPSQVSMVMTVEKIDGKWLASKLDAPFLKPADAPPAGPAPADPSAPAPAPTAPGGN